MNLRGIPLPLGSVLTAFALLSTAACADTEPEDTSGGEQIRIEHALGETVLDGPPERVVTLTPADTDVALALGVTPVGFRPHWSSESGLAGWQEEAFGDAEFTLLGDAETEVVPLEALAELEPDLILAGNYYRIADEYEDLSMIAPTTGPQTTGGEDTWQQVVESGGAALGKPEVAQELIEEVEASIAAVATDYPEVEGSTFSFSLVQEPGTVNVLKEPDDITVRFLEELGLVLSPESAGLSGDSFAAQISYERLDLLEADIALVHYYTDEARESVEDTNLFQSLDIAKDERYLALSQDEFLPLRETTVLSIPITVEQLVPRINEALE